MSNPSEKFEIQGNSWNWDKFNDAFGLFQKILFASYCIFSKIRADAKPLDYA